MKLRRVFGGTGGALAWLLIGGVVGVLAALLATRLMETSITTRSDLALTFGAPNTDDDGVVWLPIFDADDDGASDPAGMGPNAARTATNIASCTAALVGNVATITLTDSYANGWCNWAFSVTNDEETFALTLQPLSVDVGSDPVEIGINPADVGVTIPAAGGTEILEGYINVLSGAPGGQGYGPYSFQVDFAP